MAPDKVLHKLYANLEVLKLRGDELADQIQKRLRLIVSAISELLSTIAFLFFPLNSLSFDSYGCTGCRW